MSRTTRFPQWIAMIGARLRASRPRRRGFGPVRGAARTTAAWLETRVLLAAGFAEFADPNPNPGNSFGARVVPLDSGNVVVTSPFDDAGGTDAGAVYLFNGMTGALISTLRGSHAGDQIGSQNIITLPGGNFLILSPKWDNGAVKEAGAITFGNGTSGVSGTVGIANSLVGSHENDTVGSESLFVLSNGNYLYRTLAWYEGRGAVTFGSGTNGVKGELSASNSLVGSKAGDQVGKSLYQLTSGGYVIASPQWDKGAVENAGAVTWGSSTTGVKGVISASNSLVGSVTGDAVGSNGVTVLSNGNYVVSSPDCDVNGIVNAGAATWGNGMTGVKGAVGAANSLIGSTLNDSVGVVTPLPNGNYLVNSISWDNGATGNVGAVTWANGATGIKGTISAANSLVGSSANDFIGDVVGGVVVLSNGNYIVRSYRWDNGSAVDAGAVTWANGTAGVKGTISAANSLVGDRTGNSIGSGAITELPSGAYLIQSPTWDILPAADVGAVTWVSGIGPISGVVSAANSLVGSSANDRVGTWTITVLTNGNYVVPTPNWKNGTAASAGAVTWGSGTSGVKGVVSVANSLIGAKLGDNIGSRGIVPLANGNYVVRSNAWDNGSAIDAGAVTWGSGTTGVKGVVSSTNSLVGTTKNSSIGAGPVTALPNGNYIVQSPDWDNGATANVGAVTWGSGTTGVKGAVGATNSLIGSTANDAVGGAEAMTVLPNGNYIVKSPGWDNGSQANAGAVTWGSGTAGVKGVVSASNSLIGTTGGDMVGTVTVLANGNYLVRSPLWNNGAALDAGAITWASGATGIVGTITPSNSLVGTTTSDRVGETDLLLLPNGNYVATTPTWDNGAIANAGAVTWGNGAIGIVGAITSARSLVGSSTDDAVGSGGLTVLGSGNYLVRSAGWNNGAIQNAGAVTWCSGTQATTGVVSGANSLIGGAAETGLGGSTLDAKNGRFYARFFQEGGGRVRAGSQYSGVAPAPRITLTQSVSMLRRDRNLANGLLVATLSVTWPGATFPLLLAGPDAALFELRNGGTQLWLKSGTQLNYLQNPLLEVSVTINDPGLPGNPDELQAMTITVGTFRDDLVGYDGTSGEWHVQKSNGAALTDSVYATWAASLNLSMFVTGDFNGDGQADIAGRGTDGIWYVGSNTGNSFVRSSWGTWSTAVTWSQIQVGDFDGDGRDDVVGWVATQNKWYVARSTGSSFASTAWRTVSAANWSDFKIGDFNGDGRSDILMRNLNDGRVFVLNSTGAAFGVTSWATWSTAYTWNEQLIGDFDGDGRDDVAGYIASLDRWYVSRSLGNAFATTAWRTGSTAANWSASKSGDFNGDGKTDILMRNLADGRVYALISTGAAFNAVQWGTWSTSSAWSDLQIGDFDGDGRDDVALRVSSLGSWFVARSTGTAFITTQWGTWSTSANWKGVGRGNLS
jgi:hypothetical protein